MLRESNYEEEHIVDGYWHRTDGPALIWKCGSEHWYSKGLMHRIDGPAVIPYDNKDGEVIRDGMKEWWLEGKRFSEREFNESDEAKSIKKLYKRREIIKNILGG